MHELTYHIETIEQFHEIMEKLKTPDGWEKLEHGYSYRKHIGTLVTVNILINYTFSNKEPKGLIPQATSWLGFRNENYITYNTNLLGFRNPDKNAPWNFPLEYTFPALFEYVSDRVIDIIHPQGILDKLKG
jgi:hypothetical protein